MNTTFARHPMRLAVSCALVLGFATGAANAQNFGPASERELWTDSPKQQVWKNGFGECWHSAYGPPPPSTPECDPNYRAAAPPAPPPAPVAATPPPPPPRVVAAVPQRVVQKVTLDADALFDFDKAVLRPEGRASLDAFAGQLGGIQLESITATGHTDRFGSDSYNQTLSNKRADAVKAYLISKGVAPTIVRAEGMGETQPVTKAGECLGPKNAKVVACLQPDRRVEVELVGTR